MISEAITAYMDASDSDIPPLPSSNDNGESKEARSKRLKAERDRKYRESKRAGASKGEPKSRSAGPKGKSKPKAEKAAKPKRKAAEKAAPKPKTKAKGKTPKSKAKGSGKVKDARTMPRDERPDTEALILKLIRRKAMTARQLEETGEFWYLKISGIQEALKRLFAKGMTEAVATEREGRDGRPPFAYRAK